MTTSPSKCRYCGHRHTCEITDPKEQAECPHFYESHNTSRKQARRLRQMRGRKTP